MIGLPSSASPSARLRGSYSSGKVKTRNRGWLTAIRLGAHADGPFGLGNQSCSMDLLAQQQVLKLWH